jgi:hypothetical protein
VVFKNALVLISKNIKDISLKKLQKNGILVKQEQSFLSAFLVMIYILMCSPFDKSSTVGSGNENFLQ